MIYDHLEENHTLFLAHMEQHLEPTHSIRPAKVESWMTKVVKEGNHRCVHIQGAFSSFSSKDEGSPTECPHSTQLNYTQIGD